MQSPAGSVERQTIWKAIFFHAPLLIASFSSCGETIWKASTKSIPGPCKGASNSPRIRGIFSAGKSSSKVVGYLPVEYHFAEENRGGCQSNLHGVLLVEFIEQGVRSGLSLCIHFAQGELNRKSDSLLLWHNSCPS